MDSSTTKLQEFAFGAVDEPTASLILQIQSQDVNDLLNVKKGKSREGDVSDADLALEIYHGELEKRAVIQRDQTMARSLTRAVISDAELLKDSITEETRAIYDRAMAQRLSTKTRSSEGRVVAVSEPTINDGLVARLAAVYISGQSEGLIAVDDTQDETFIATESSAWAASRSAPSNATHHQCTSCATSKPLFDVFQAPCGHFYCQECLHTLVELSLKDETLFPARCCRQEFALQSLKLYLEPTLIHMVEQKSLEFLASNRTYCSQRTCSSFIPSSNISNDQGTCAVCDTKTCIICKSNTHSGDCPEDIATQQVLETAREEGWQRCYNCGRLVELDVGCNHMVYVTLQLGLVDVG